MQQIKNENLGSSPLQKGKRTSAKSLFKKPSVATKNNVRDLTGQTDTTLKEMKQRLKEVPKKSSGNEHDKDVYKDNQK